MYTYYVTNKYLCMCGGKLFRIHGKYEIFRKFIVL